MKPALWQTAAAFSARAHEHQYRADGGTPYYSHCSRVALVLAVVFECTDDTVIAAALLHDTIEDTPTDFDEIAEEFGRPVAACVSAMTKNHLLPEAERERDYDRRLAKADWRARLVKLADVYDNFTDARSPAKRRRITARVRRAIALARPDARKHAETARAIKALSKLIGARS